MKSLVPCLMLFLAAVACTQSRPGSRVPSPTAAPRLVADELISPDKPLRVSFRWIRRSDAPAGLFAWRQAGGVRRWDFLPGTDGDATSGSFYIERFNEEGRAVSSIGCLWFEKSPDKSSLSCAEGGAPSDRHSVLSRTLLALISRRIGATTILGEQAGCYEFAGDTVSGNLCRRSIDHFPLSFDVYDASSGQKLKLAAVSTGTTVGSIDLPSELQTGTGRPDLVVDHAVLNVPEKDLK